MTFIEQRALAGNFLSKLAKVENPDENLKRDVIINSFKDSISDIEIEELKALWGGTETDEKSKTIWPLATHRGRLAPKKRPKKVTICDLKREYLYNHIDGDDCHQ